jgi:hypothetical protein
MFDFLFDFLFEFLFDVLFDVLFDNDDFLTFVLFHVLHQSLRARRNVPGTSKKCYSLVPHLHIFTS